MFYGDGDMQLTFESLFTPKQIDHTSDNALHVPSQYTVTLGSEPRSYQSAATKRQLNLAEHDGLPHGNTHLLFCLGKCFHFFTTTPTQCTVSVQSNEANACS